MYAPVKLPPSLPLPFQSALFGPIVRTASALAAPATVGTEIVSYLAT